MKPTDQQAQWIAVLLISIGVWQLREQPFFWDTVVLSSRQGSHYLSILSGGYSGWATIFPPNDIDPGHPALWGAYLGLCWKIAGKSLLVSHLATLPFLWLIVVQASWLTRYAIGPGHAWKTLLLLVALPPLAGHLALVTPDVALLALWLTAMRAVLQQSPLRAAVALFFLGLVSLRALPLMAGLGLWLLAQAGPIALIRRWGLVFVAGGSGLALWLAGHWLAKGWLLSHEASPWAEHRGLVSPTGLLRNAAATGFWLLQYGAVLVTIPAIYLAFKALKKYWKTQNWRSLPPIFSLWLATGLALAAFTVPFSNPVNPRYWLPVLLLGTIWLVSQAYNWQKWKFIVLALLLASGNFWLLPPPIANAWDCTLAHLWVKDAQKEFYQSLDNKGIKPESVGADFPLLAARENINFTNKASFHPYSTDNDSLIVYSNLCNGFSDSLQAAFRSHWQPVVSVQQGPVQIQLLRRK